MKIPMNFSRQDCEQLAEQGIEPAAAARQLAWLRSGQAMTRLVRPCTPGDGIVQIRREDHARLNQAFGAAAAAGRLQRFIPASGAATRMFGPLQADAAVLSACRRVDPARSPGPAETALRRFLDQLESFAFYTDLAGAMADDGHDLRQALADRDLELIIRYLLTPCGLGYASLPKGLLAFHTAADGARTPFVEHLAEAALLNGLEGTVTLHFTVSAEHLPLFRAQFAAWRSVLEETYGCRFAVTYSTQKPSTDTLAMTTEGQPLRDAQGRLLLRPGGHGALLENLNDLAGDIVLIRNIDNVVPDALKQANLVWTRLLTGYLLTVQEEQHALLKALHEQPGDPLVRELTAAFLADRLQVAASSTDDARALRHQLDRPVRVCGMVPNSGEPGGGPFWVRDARGMVSRQIVEGAQIDRDDPGQAAIMAGATHFNPVDMACGVSDWRGRPYNLTRFVDDDAVIVTSKVQDGREVRVLERPGLWNGAMAGWHTLFVEMPAETFNPVKTVFDLLRPAHQAG
jgi:hypothetical protein